MDASIHRRK